MSRRIKFTSFMKIIKPFKYQLLISASHVALNNGEMSHLSIEGATL